MIFKKYIHIERLTSEEVQGLLNAPCYLLPKLDGANGSIWINEGKLCCGSRNNELDVNNTNQGFYNYVQNNAYIFKPFFDDHPDAIIYGEWLIPHTIKDYVDDAWHKFYAFDVEIRGSFWNHEAVRVFLERYGIHVVPIINVYPTISIEDALNQCTWLLKDDKKHEGIIIKRDNFVNKFGRVTYGKYVPISLRAIGKECTGKRLEAYADSIEATICHEFLTEHLITKEIAKIQNERGFTTLDPKLIGETLGRVWHAFITEEIWDILKKFKMPTIDFGLLKKHCDQKVRIKFGI